MPNVSYHLLPESNTSVAEFSNLNRHPRLYISVASVFT